MNLIRPYLAVGGLRDIQSASLLAQHNISAIVSIAEPVAHEGIDCLYVPFDDGVAIRAGDLQKVVAFVWTNKEKDGTTLIACALGVSRSASLATAAIKEIENVDLLSAYCMVKRARSEVRPHPILWQSLCHFYNEDVPYLTMLRAACKENQ